MDQTLKPLLIPPQFALYVEKHAIFDLYQRLLSQLIRITPEEPIDFIIQFIKKDANSSAILIIGPPSSGKKTLSRLLAKATGSVLLTQDTLYENMSKEIKAELGGIDRRKLKPHQWAQIIKHRIGEYDCARKGWILEGYPDTREQAQAMLAAGVLPKHSVVLHATDAMLIERAAGKRVDTETGFIYHTTFDWPTETSVQQRLVVANGNTEAELIGRLINYHRNIGGIRESLAASAKSFNVDQPKGDVFTQILEYVGRPARSHAPSTPRILLIGPCGAGKQTQAAALSKKYDIANICVSHLISEAIAQQTTLGQAMRGHNAANMPLSLLAQLLSERLTSQDCITRGWVLHGMPLNLEQAEWLDRSGFAPNRAFFLDIPNDSILERTTLRLLDPVTGEHYHMLFNPPPTQDIRDRLQQRAIDSEVSVKGKIGAYYSHVRHLVDFYEAVGVHINADQDPNTVFESIESALVNQIPTTHSVEERPI